MKSKKLFSLLLAVLILSTPSAFASALDQVRVTLNGKEVAFDQPPIIEKGRVIVQVVNLFKALNVDMEWDDAKQEITAEKDDLSIWMKIGYPAMIAYREGSDVAREIVLDVSPQFKGDSIFVPVRAVAEALGAKVEWDGANRVVSIRSLPGTAAEFVAVFAEQMARYNQIAPLCWPDNAVVDKSVVMEDVDTCRLWLIAPDGAVTELSEEDAEQMGVSRRDRPDDFSFYEDGIYISISDQSVKDQAGRDKPHVGSYDSILWLTHEGFHKWEQGGKWDMPNQESIVNIDRDEFFLDIPARAKRNLLQKQLMQAVARPGEPDLILDALATFEDYRTKNAEDYENTLFYDRIEGTAKYFEFVSSLYIFFPDEVKSKEDLEKMIAKLALNEGAYIQLGVVSESYNVGMFACVLLDRLDENWKERIKREPFVTPLEILSSYYEDETLHEPKQLSPEEIEGLTENVREKIRFLAARQKPVLTAVKQGLDAMPEEERIVYEMFLDEMLLKFKEMITILPEEEQKTFEDFIKAMEE